jgi:hypothetical protein
VIADGLEVSECGTMDRGAKVLPGGTGLRRQGMHEHPGQGVGHGTASPVWLRYCGLKPAAYWDSQAGRGVPGNAV